MLSISHSLVRGLLTRDMNRFQRLLNRRLIDRCLVRFRQVHEVKRRKLQQQLKSIPRHARAKWLEEAGFKVDRRRPENQALRQLIDFLVRESGTLLEELARLKKQNSRFRSSIARTHDQQDRRQLILDYSASLGASRWQLMGDSRAIKRGLNEDAMNDRFIQRAGESEQRLAFTLERLGRVAGHAAQLVGRRRGGGDPVSKADPQQVESWDAGAIRSLWKRLRLTESVHRVFEYDGDARVHLAALKCLSSALDAIPAWLSPQLLDDSTVQLASRTASDRSLDVWVQSEAFSILQRAARDEFAGMAYVRLAEPDVEDDMFVRRHVAALLQNAFTQNLAGAGSPANMIAETTGFAPGLELLRLAARDASDFVRQQAAVSACYAPIKVAQEILHRLAHEDGCEKVRAATLLAVFENAHCKPLHKKLHELLHITLTEESDEFVVRTAVLLSWKWLERYEDQITDETTARYERVLLPDLLRLESGSETTVPMRRWSAQARERIWLLNNPAARKLHERLKQRGQTIKPGRAKRIPRSWLRGFDEFTIGRILSVVAQDDFGYDLDKDLIGWRLVRGPVFKFRLWRFWFELRNQATDKRQAFHHMIGRASDARVRAPSQIMGELSQTKVPGEPFLIASDGSWRPFLPLVDDFISALHCNWFVRRPVRFFTSQGVTEIETPRSIVGGLRAYWKLTFGFPWFAALRNWDDDPQNKPTDFLDGMRELGFRITLRPHGETMVQTGTHDTSVRRFFAATSAVSILPPDVWRLFMEYSSYFSSAYENSLTQLVLFVSVFLALFVLKHLFANFVLRRARRAIPLSIGGWGTRGKSGTERLKAALIGGMGHGLVSKTTGCEAMFIHANAFGEPLEIPLFRPYDKATIWEQSDILRLAAKLNPSVFLWECMGLTPSYVEVLSRQWTCDDLATITNTYPDHEDLQGPAGYNVATTISGFVPRKSHMITTEEEMLPLVANSCRSVGTSLRGVGWLQAGLITDDVQDRFPYKEHPNNIALVSAMGDELGLSYEYCVKAMADYLVPDLGVLKVYPVSTVRKRRIEFTNGMSANERFGCLGNWTRLGYAESDPYELPDTWITGVVNNRADRVPRSRVFASIMVHDVSVDRFFLIGNNLAGLQSFIADAWAEKSQQYKLIQDEQQWDKSEARRSLVEAAREFRQPTSMEHVQSRLAAMVRVCVAEAAVADIVAQAESPEAVAAALSVAGEDAAIIASVRTHHESHLRAFHEFSAMATAIDTGSDTNLGQLNQQFVDLLRAWFDRKIVVVEDYGATGEEVVQRLVEESPPGFLNRNMGLQNIKGTGLDFVYRFQAWDACYNACEQLLDTNMRVVEKGLQALSSMPILGQLCEAKVRETIQFVRQAEHLQRSDIQSELELIESRIAVPSSLAAAPSSTEQSRKAESSTDLSSISGEVSGISSSTPSRWSEFKEWLRHTCEQYFDPHDAVHRRNNADRIYKDLSKGRISRQSAVEQLRTINKRQKGGWFGSEEKK